MTVLTSNNGELRLGHDQPVVLINDQLRIMDQTPAILDSLQRGELGPLVEIARIGMAAGLDMVDILLDHPSLDHVDLLPKAAAAIHDEVGCPIALDSRHPRALRAALQALAPHKALINSITAEPDVLEQLLPIAAEFGAAIVGMPIGQRHGLPRSAVGRVEEARVILDAAVGYGIPSEDVVIDAICLASSAEPGSMQITLETLRLLHKELGVATVLGIGNAGHGMPQPTTIDLAYLLAAIPWGLDAALVNPTTPMLVQAVRALDFLTARDPYGKGYLSHYRAHKGRRAPEVDRAAASGEGRV